jgi:Spx/MgsR family transcriptional regulator
MAMTLYGIRNCNTMKQAQAWLEEQGLAFKYHDYKRDGVDLDAVALWLEEVGAALLVNRRGTTWRKLSEVEKAACDGEDPGAIALVLSTNPSLIKRPVLATPRGILVGFDPEQWQLTLLA